MTDTLVLAEGKTKRIKAHTANTVLVENKDTITAGDGAKRDEFSGKGVASTRTTTNVFELLNRRGVPTHFLRRYDDRTFEALYCDMIPLECVCRRILTGSWLKRNPGDEEGTVLDEMTFEIFFKDDDNNDPLIIPRFVGPTGDTVLDLFRADAPVGEQAIGQIDQAQAELWLPHLPEIERLTRQTFAIIEEALAEIDIDGEALVFVDGKVEFGLTSDGRLVLADVVDNDSWRVWKGGQKSGQVDKQVFREIVGQMSPDQRQSLKKLFEQVAAATDGFARL